MIFSHDIELSLLAVVDLINTDPECGGKEGLPDPDSLRHFVATHAISEVTTRDYEDLAALYVVRRRLRGAFGLPHGATIAAAINPLLAQAPISPRLTAHDGYAWHVHYFAAGASLANHVAVDGAMALAHVVAAGETERLRVCAAPDCDAVLVDLSRNRSKRYCDARTCGNRLNVAAYRARKRRVLAASSGA